MGAATAKVLATRGAKVIVSDIVEGTARETCEAIRAAGGIAEVVLCDVAEEAQVEALVASTVDLFGRLDCAVNNAAITPDNLPIAEADMTVFDKVLRVDLRSVMTQGMVSEKTAGRLAQAKSVMYWHSRHRFCSNCGAETQVGAAGWKRVCAACKAEHFPRTDPVVIMLAVSGDKCLLGRQPRFPKGMFSALAGFVEGGETLEDAVRREIKEEAGISCGKVTYMASQPWPFPCSLMIGCLAEAEDEKITIDVTELDDARWFSREDALKLVEGRLDGFFCPPKFAIAHQLIASWARGEVV